MEKHNAIKSLLLLLVFVVALGSVTAMEPVVIRVLSANPSANTYTFACLDNGSGLAGNGVRNWYIYPEDTGVDELITSLPANQSLSYTFQRKAYYDITCEVPNPPGLNYTSLYRHSLHIDSRPSITTPAVIPLSVGPGSITERCDYNGTGATGISWFVSTYGYTGGSGNTVRYWLNTTNDTITFTPPFAPGLFDTHCLVHLQSGQDIDVPFGIDFLSNTSAPYVADQYGINANNNFAPFNYNTWASLHNYGGTTTNTTNQTVNNTGNQTTNITTNSTNGSTSGTNTSGTYYNLNGIPASCTGGTITSDVYSGGSRTISCSGGSNSLTIQAWDKPTSTSPQYFEMYMKSITGSGIKICIATTCISNNGYAKSPNYPIIYGNTSGTMGNTTGNQTTNQTGNMTGNVTGNNTIAYTSVYTMPASCTGGTITSDTKTSGRAIICASGGNSLSITAWNKPSDTAPQYFEMYKKSQTGSGIKICLLSTCISDNGYAKSPNFPIYGPANTTNTTSPPPTNTTTNQTGNQTGNTSSNGTYTYYHVQSMPAVCNGGTITSDTFFSGRDIICSGAGSTLEVGAWDKPDSNNATYFEMDKLSQTGSGLSICIGTTCIADNGYAQSPNFPITLSSPPINGTTNTTTNTTTNNTGNMTAPVYNTNPNNQPPQPPVWMEPAATGVYPNDFHLHVYNAVDAENDTIIYSDYEIWDVPANQLVWYSYNETVDPYHIHRGDGIFTGNLAGQTQLLYNHTYQARARFYEWAQYNNVSNWSVWRVFQTIPPINITPTTYSWTPAPGYSIQTVASGVNLPVNVVIAPQLYGSLPSGSQPHLYVSQLYGQISVILNDGTVKPYATNLLNYQAFGSLPGSGETGVDGLYVDQSTGDVYASITSMDNTSITGMYGNIWRFTTNASGDGYTTKTLIKGQIPVRPSHHVHTILKGPDGKMYVSVGDADQNAWPQDPTTLNGKVLRMNWDGSMPSDNPFPGTYTYALGFRNPFGMAFRPGTNELYVSNNGQDTDDGLYKTFAGSKFGWCCNLTQGVWHGWPIEIAPTQVAFDPYGAFPNDTNNVYVAGSGSTYLQGPSPNSKRIFQEKINPDGSWGGESVIATYTGAGYGAPIGIAFAPDGMYFTDIYGDAGFTGVGVTQGNIYKIVWTGQNTTLPPPPTNTTFSAALSSAAWYPQGLNEVWVCNAQGGSGNFTYDFVFGDGNQQLGLTANNVYHTYPAHGTYTASCTVHDMSNGQQVSATTSITL